MFDRFTDRGRKIMALARKEAERFNHDYIGTEHILLGLLKEKTGVAAIALQNLGFDIEKTYKNLEQKLPLSPKMVTLGQLPFTSQTKTLLEKAVEVADEWGHSYIGTEHILYALINPLLEKTQAYQILHEQNISPIKVKEEIFELLSQEIQKQKTHEAERPWSISKNRLTLEKALELEGYRIGDVCIEAVLPYRPIYPEKGSSSIGKIQTKGKETEVVILYDLKYLSQIQNAIKLKEFLNNSGESYQENPSSKEVIFRLSSSISETTSLIDRLKK